LRHEDLPELLNPSQLAVLAGRHVSGYSIADIAGAVAAVTEGEPDGTE
jgi:hypothetical protein